MTKQMLKAYLYCAHRMEPGRGNNSDWSTVTEVESFVAAISDALTQDIIRGRYMLGHSWVRIGIDTNNTADNCRKISERYLRKNDVL